MTLEKTWKECLRMWKWVAYIRMGRLDDTLHRLDVLKLKAIWLSTNNYDDILNDCFFCDYADEHSGNADPGDCEKCPGQFVDREFNCCKDPNYLNKSIEFYNLLVKLNKKRLSKKGKR